MRYEARCPLCGRHEEYDSPISEPEKNIPTCWHVAANGEDGTLMPGSNMADDRHVQGIKMEKIFAPGKTYVVFKGPNWAGRGKAGY